MAQRYADAFHLMLLLRKQEGAGCVDEWGIQHESEKFLDLVSGRFNKQLWWHSDSGWIKDCFSSDEKMVRGIFESLSKNQTVGFEVLDEIF
jgi:hypothetical protein